MASVLAGAAEPGDIDYFETHIRPLLAKRCYACHSREAKKLKAHLYLDSRAGWQVGGDSGTALVPGKPDASLLVKAIRYKDTDLQMPPKSKLPGAEIERLVEWVKRGAPDPREGKVEAPVKAEIDIEGGRAFWAFQGPVKPAIPQVRQGDWPRSDIDRFILARLESAGIRPGKMADKASLIRRVHFDLTGLPPSPDEIDSFVQDDTPDALAQRIDRLLARPAFGERWGRHWLDVARYAESSGGGRSLMFKDAWRYRDYVIASFNQDKPYDRFVKEQIAGDLLPYDSPAQRGDQLCATGYLALGPTNYELQDKALLQMDVVDEQIDTIGRTFLGLTIGCARCHDHKFDPIPTRDYYAMAGIFTSTQTLTPGNVSSYVMREIPLEGEERLKREKSEKEIAALTAAYNAARKKRDALGKPAKGQKEIGAKSIAKAQLRGIVIDNREAKREGLWKDSVHSPYFVDDGYIHDDHGNDRGRNKTVTFSPKIPQGGMYEVRLSYAPGVNRPHDVPVDIDHTDGRTTVRVNQSEKPPIDDLFISLGQFRFEADIHATVTIRNDCSAGAVIADAVQWIRVEELAENTSSLKPASGEKPVEKEKPDPKLAADNTEDRKLLDAEVNRLDKALKELKKSAGAKPGKVMAVQDAKSPTDGHIHIKGGVRNLGDKVPRGFLRVLMQADDRAQIPDQHSGRLELANWIANAEHPLTARVMVNRVWHHLLGVGLVRTPDNFGTMGESPSHPALLDYLALRFSGEGWSVKALLRNIMLSSVYQLSTEERPDARRIDADNRLLWRAHRRRLDAEALRDTLLHLSGQLDRRAGGLTISKISEYDNGYKHGKPLMRSVYVPAFRAAPLEFLSVFDVANPNLVTGRRSVSTVSTQSLFLMNSPFVMEQAKHAAERLAQRKESGHAARIDRAYREILGRSPTKGERSLAEAFISGYDQAEPEESLTAWIRLCHVLFASVDFRYLN